MATAKKTAPKKVVKKAPTTSAQLFSMTQEVKDWIDQASSRINAMRTEIDGLKEENKRLKQNHKIMERRVMGMSNE